MCGGECCQGESVESGPGSHVAGSERGDCVCHQDYCQYINCGYMDISVMTRGHTLWDTVVTMTCRRMFAVEQV